LANVVYYNYYKIKEGASAADFQKTVEELFSQIAATHKGVVSLTLLNEGDQWADCCVFETMEDLNAFVKSSQEAYEQNANPLAAKFYSFLDWDENARSHQFNFMASVKANDK